MARRLVVVKSVRRWSRFPGAIEASAPAVATCATWSRRARRGCGENAVGCARCGALTTTLPTLRARLSSREIDIASAPASIRFGIALRQVVVAELSVEAADKKVALRRRPRTRQHGGSPCPRRARRRSGPSCPTCRRASTFLAPWVDSGPMTRDRTSAHAHGSVPGLRVVVRRVERTGTSAR